MAITYHAGRRLQGTSTDAIAVSGGWKEIGRTTLSNTVPSTPTVSDDMTTDKGWVSTSGDWSYNATNDDIDLTAVRRSTTAQLISIDLQDSDYLGTGINLSDKLWTIRLGKFQVNGMGTGGGCLMIVALSNNLSDSGSTQNSVGFDYNLNTSDPFVRARSTTGNFETGTMQNSQFSSARNPAIGTDFIWEIVRNGDDFTVNAYAGTDTTYSTILESETVTNSAISGLRYLKIINDSEQNNSIVGDIECFIGGIKIYNGFATGVSSNIIVTGLPDKRYYMVLGHAISNAGGGSAQTQQTLRFNGDDASNQYGRRYNTAGGNTDADSLSNRISTGATPNSAGNGYTVAYIANKSDKEKLVISHGIETADVTRNNYAPVAPTRYEAVGKWRNTTDSINEITIYNPTAGCNFDIDSECIVLGWTPEDTHQDNFWTELKSVTQLTDATTLDSGTFTAKKYMWIQIQGDSSSNISPALCFNGDLSSGTNNLYSLRNNFGVTGSSNADDTSETSIEWIALNQAQTGSHNEYFSNIFIDNAVSPKNKLLIINTAENDTSGAGTAPNRTQVWGKYCNADQINRVTLTFRDGGAGNVLAGSVMTIWGSD